MKNSIAKGDLKGLSALDAVSSLGPDELEAQWKALYTERIHPTGFAAL